MNSVRSKIQLKLATLAVILYVLVITCVAHAQYNNMCGHNSYTVPRQKAVYLGNNRNHWIVTEYYRYCSIIGCDGYVYDSQATGAPSPHRHNGVIVNQTCTNGTHTFYTECRIDWCRRVYPHSSHSCSGLPPHITAPFSMGE